MTVRDVLLKDFGGSLIELALVVPLFTLLLLGAAEFGRLAYSSIEVSNAANAAAQYAVQSSATSANTSAIQTAASNDAANITGLTTTVTTWCACSSGISITCATAISCISPGRVEGFVEVQTSATMSTVFHYPGLPTTYTLQGQAIMRVRQ